MELKIEITDEQIADALNRQVRVVLGHYFQTKEINSLITTHIKSKVPELLAESIKSIPDEEIKKVFMDKLSEALAVKVKQRLKGL